jgi:hypothetical protein
MVAEEALVGILAGRDLNLIQTVVMHAFEEHQRGPACGSKLEASKRGDVKPK